MEKERQQHPFLWWAWGYLSEQRLGGRTLHGPFVWSHGFGWGGGAAGKVGARFDRALDGGLGVWAEMTCD